MPITIRWQRGTRGLAITWVMILALSACDESSDEGDPTTTVNAASSAGDAAVADFTATATNGRRAATVPSGVYIATPPSGEPITRAAPTAPIGPQPTRTSQFDSNGDGFYTYEGFEAAIEALYPTYEWPANYHVDPVTLLSSYAEYRAGGAEFEVGAEYTIIGLRHACAWEFAWLDVYRSSIGRVMRH